MKTPRLLLTLALLLSCKAYAFTPVLPVQAGTNGVIISPTNFVSANGLITTNGVPLASLPLAVVTNGESYTNLSGYPFLSSVPTNYLTATSSIPLASLPLAVVTNGESYTNLSGYPFLSNSAAFDTNGAATAVSNSLTSSLTNYTLKSTLSVLATNSAFAGLTALPTTLAGHGITNAVTNGSSITNLTGYNVVVTNGATVLTNGSALPWASVTGSPTSLSGYGITNAILSNGSAATNLTGLSVLATNTAFAGLTALPTTLAGHGITNAAPLIQTISNNTATNYTMAIADVGTLAVFTNTTNVTITIPAQTNVAFAVGTRIDLTQTGAGRVLVTNATNVTINSAGGYYLRTNYSAASLYQIATNVWILVGDISIN